MIIRVLEWGSAAEKPHAPLQPESISPSGYLNLVLYRHFMVHTRSRSE